MGVPVLAVNLSQHSHASTVGTVDPASDAAGAMGMVDLFAALLAQQVGQFHAVTDKGVVVGQSGSQATEDKADPASSAESTDALMAAMSNSTTVDPSLLAQQAALVPHVVPSIVGESKVVIPSETQSGVAGNARVGEVSGSAQGVAIDVKGVGARQSVAADSATFAISQDVMKPSQNGAELAKSPLLPATVPVQDKAADLTVTQLPAAEKTLETKLLQAAETSGVLPQTQQVIAVPAAAAHSGMVNNVAAAPQGTPQPVGGISYQVGHSAWGEALGNQVVWMVGQNHQGVELHLNPPSLGPLEVRLSMSDGQANLSFATQHLTVKDAIDSATPRLREMLGESGISLGSVSVNVGSFTQQSPNEQTQQSSSGRAAWAEVAPVTDFTSTISTKIPQIGRNGLVDIFA